MFEHRRLMIAETLLDVEDAAEKYSWEGIFNAIQRGNYATRYAVGDMIPLDLGSEGQINMQIAAFDADTLADGSGNKAHITFISKEQLRTKHRMNPNKEGTSGNYTEGTGSVGGWEKSEMRTYLNQTIKPLIPGSVRGALKTVYKSHPACNTSTTYLIQTTSDDVWIPSSKEVFDYVPAIGSGNYEPFYSTLFTDNNSRKKTAVGATAASHWWLRTAGEFSSATTFYTTSETGSHSGGNAFDDKGVVLGFCL